VVGFLQKVGNKQKRTQRNGRAVRRSQLGGVVDVELVKHKAQPQHTLLVGDKENHADKQAQRGVFGSERCAKTSGEERFQHGLQASFGGGSVFAFEADHVNPDEATQCFERARLQGRNFKPQIDQAHGHDKRPFFEEKLALAHCKNRRHQRQRVALFPKKNRTQNR
jgi:hypothetical protein